MNVIRNEITETFKEICDYWKLEETEFNELKEVPLENFQEKVRALVKTYFMYLVISYEDSLNTLRKVKDSVEESLQMKVLRHFILKTYLDGGTLSIY